MLPLRSLKKILVISFLLNTVSYGFGQSQSFSEYLNKPRLDTTYWSKDTDAIFRNRPNKTAECTTCITSYIDSIYNKSCFNSVSGHVKLDTNLECLTIQKLIGEWELIEGGVFEISDSISVKSGIVYRTKKKS